MKKPLLSVLISGILLSAACSAPKTTIRAAGNQGMIRFIVRPDDARVYVDGQDKGEAENYENEDTPLVVDSGVHNIEIKREGYKSFQKEVYMSGGTLYEIMVNLGQDK
ncbi:MAG: PEGA domain-containing protein [Candidatus Schekmanbacteria bacterium]|nr:PEGA domain-containing protein [Candidatus Schekmanbacteria bacterium]